MMGIFFMKYPSPQWVAEVGDRRCRCIFGTSSFGIQSLLGACSRRLLPFVPMFMVRKRYNIATGKSMERERKKVVMPALCAFLVSTFAAFSLIFGGFCMLMAFIFFQNFHLPNHWHSFVLAYTFVTPVLSLVGIVIFAAHPSRKSAIFSILTSLAVFANYLVWNAAGSSGLIH